METVKTKLLIIASLILLVTSMGTCRFKKNSQSERIVIMQDTSLINQLTNDNLFLQQQFKKRVAVLQAKNDNLAAQVKEKKQQLSAYRFKTDVLESKLKEVLIVADSSGAYPDSLTVIAENYIDAQHQKDSVCSETIVALETQVAVKDSTESAHLLIETALNDALKLQDLKVRNISDQLNFQTNEVKKRTRQNKLLRGGLWLLTGVSASLLIMQARK